MDLLATNGRKLALRERDAFSDSSTLPMTSDALPAQAQLWFRPVEALAVVMSLGLVCACHGGKTALRTDRAAAGARGGAGSTAPRLTDGVPEDPPWDAAISGAGGTPSRSSLTDASVDGDAGRVAVDTRPDGSFELMGAPLIFAPTAHSVRINAVLAQGSPSELQASMRPAGKDPWYRLEPPEVTAEDTAQWTATGLEPKTRYEYTLGTRIGDEAAHLYTGSAVTQRPPGEAFVFALLTDTHISPREEIPTGTETANSAEETLLQVAQAIRTTSPDFIANLGDILDFHRFGFNQPPPDGSWTRLGYLNYRRLLGDTLGNASHFFVIGNWDGETGCFTDEEISRSREQRLLYAPGPQPDTYPQGGSPYEDYYAFTWGDALFVVLNVMSYTPTCHMLSSDPGVADDWTLGEEQLAWLREELASDPESTTVIAFHAPVFETTWHSEDREAFPFPGSMYLKESAEMRTLFAQYLNIKLYVHGHLHHTYGVRDENGRGEYCLEDGVLHISVGSTTNSRGSSVLFIGPDKIVARVRDHVKRRWRDQFELTLPTKTTLESTVGRSHRD